MATDGYLRFDGKELVNLSRTAQLAETLGIGSVWVTPSQVAWIQGEVGGPDYSLPENAPWYDADYPASSEFAGIIPLGFPGLDDSTTEASTSEYITDGGRSGAQRNATLVIVASVALVASTERGAEYGKRWLDRSLRAAGSTTFCSGSELRYFRWAGENAPTAHRRDVRLTRGTSITRKRVKDCDVVWLATFTLTCDDPFEYGDDVQVLDALGGEIPVGDVIDYGQLDLVKESCPVYDYTPIYDPLYPALVPSPTAPDFYPSGWDIAEGDAFHRYWARVETLEPSDLNLVPVIRLTTINGLEFRFAQVSVWPSDSATDDQCDPLFTAVLSYMPPDSLFYIDGEQKAAYIWNGFGEAVRRTDSLVYGPTAQPVEWAAFNDPTSLLVTLDLYVEPDGFTEGDIQLALWLVPKSD